MIEKYGWETVSACIHKIWDQSEAYVREQIRAMPDGCYVAESFLDDDGVDLDRTLPVKVAVTISGDEVTIDFTGTSEQTNGPMNAGRSGGMSAAKLAFKSVIMPRLLPNEGAFRPLKVVLPEGTLISATNNAAMAMWTVTLKTIIDTVILAFAGAVPDRVPAAHHAAMGAYSFYGLDPETGRRFSTLDTVLGGWGARPGADGFSPLKTVTHGDARNVPIEVEEAFYPLIVDRYEWRPDTGGPGEYRGGPGLQKVYRIPCSCHFLASFDRSKCPPWGILGGGSAKVGGVLVQQPGDAQPREYQKVTALQLKSGATVELLSAGGGGRGSPSRRPPERVLEDVRRGYVSIDGARRDYGVVIDASGMVVDEKATRELRASIARGSAALE